MSFSGVISEYDRLNSDTVARFALGTEARTADGRKFRYFRNSTTALVAGNLIQAPGLIANHQNIAVQAAASVGAKSVSVTLGGTLAAANDYSEGFLVVNNDDGEGRYYRIKSHPAAAANATLTLALTDPVETALATASEVCLIPNPYNRPVISATAQTGTVVGVSQVATAASEFGWLQTRGVCSVLADETITAGQMLTIGTGVAGAVEAQDLAGEPQIGIALQAGVDTEYRAVMLTID